MLQLNYVLVSCKDLSKTERIRLACRGEEFGAILTDGILKVNKDLKKPKKLEKLVRRMFEVDHLLSWEDDALFDKILNEITVNWGEELYWQIHRAWGDTLQAKLKADDEAAASAWLAQYGDVEYTDALDDLMPGFRGGVIDAIYHSSRDLRDVFNYGFQMGAKHGVKAVTA